MEIKIFYFIASIFVTIVAMYIINPQPKVIIKYPKITEKQSDLYVDDKNVCYRYEPKEIPCK